MPTCKACVFLVEWRKKQVGFWLTFEGLFSEKYRRFGSAAKKKKAMYRRSLWSRPHSLVTSSLFRTSPTLSSGRFYHERVIDHYENPRNVVGI